MDRELKFRAYYKKVSDGKYILEGEYTMKDLTDRGIKFDQEQITWCQFTGSLDENKKEVFEDDYIEHQNNEPFYKAVYKIEWGIELYGFIGKNIETGAIRQLWDIENEGQFKIIGNIYLGK